MFPFYREQGFKLVTPASEPALTPVATPMSFLLEKMDDQINRIEQTDFSQQRWAQIGQ